jgi:hypothetical protein
MKNDFQDRWMISAHAVQSATALHIERLGASAAGADAKHLRTGLNMAMSDHGALARLLVAKGIITEEEYLAAIAEGAEMEAERIAEHVRSECNLPDTVTFG